MTHKNPKLLRVITKLDMMEKQKIWPNGKRYLWTDAHGIVLLCSLYKVTGKKIWLSKAEHVMNEVKYVLGRRIGFRIGEEDDRDGQYFHYLIKYAYALHILGKLIPRYKDDALKLVKSVHPYFFVPNCGFYWKMQEDLSGPYPGFGYGGLDHYNALIIYKIINQESDGDPLANEIKQVEKIVLNDYKTFSCHQDLGCGEVLWMTHFFDNEQWAQHLKNESLKELNLMWQNDYFCRQRNMNNVKFAFTNFGISIGLQSIKKWPERVNAINEYFETYKAGDHYDYDAITHVLNCNSLFPGYFMKDFESQCNQKLKESDDSPTESQ